MNKYLQKNLATSLTALAFLVIAVSGMMMYFHLFNKLVEDLHEIIGLFFIVVVLFHVFYNFKSMKAHFKTKAFWFSAILLTSVSLLFILNTKEGNNPKQAIVMAVLNAPLETSLQVLDKELKSVRDRLKSEGIIIMKNDSIESLAKQYKVSPFHIVKIINQK